MADNKEITTLHPYMNRNKNRYPNVREENIPDTIQRKMTAGQGINISPDNVISATGGDSYTRSETDALLDTKADKLALENVNKVVPTDIAVKNGKLGLEHDTTWLTNQKAINLGENITYDVTTNTLNASGGKVPAGTRKDPFKLYTLKFYYDRDNNDATFYDDTANFRTYTRINTSSSGVNISALNLMDDNRAYISFSANISQSSSRLRFEIAGVYNKSLYFYVDNSNENSQSYIPALARPSIDGTYNLQITKTGSSYHYDWVAGGGSGLPTFNHYIVISDGTASNAIYLLIPSTNNLICSSLTELNTLLGTEHRFIQASGVVTDTASKLPIVALKWQGSIADSKILTTSSEEAVTKFTNISDIVEPA